MLGVAADAVVAGLRHRYRDGTTHIVFEPIDFVAKLAALVPPPRCHMVRYHGILAPAAKRRYTWAELMKRVFRVDVFECPRCHGRSRILAAIHPPETALAILACLKLPTRPPPVAPPDPGTDEALADFGA